ncbi:protein kinase [Streptomyces sp. Je 1-332]|uniref:protein kinase domain-containing protein n=1 Tax=Streptomyces sp. Je 1-332 TaxID=3231270 RepID=UPI0034587ADF
MEPLSIGDPLRLGPYRLLGVLGEGGMGKVYTGQDGGGTLAAVKVLRPELVHDSNLAQRFVREAHAAQAVKSKGVAAVLAAQTEGGRPWIATEFLAGLTLDQAVDACGPFGESSVRALAASIAGTLADIHAAGLIHRDLKPPNIVLTSSGPRVIDFGIARPEHGLTLTTTGQIPVTPGYGAPEQVLGHRVASPADVFSLGAVLVYAASGRRAFEGSHIAAVQYEVVHGEPWIEGLPPHLRSLIEPCLAKAPALRPTPAQIIAAAAVPRGVTRVWRSGPVAERIKERESHVRQLTTAVGGRPERQVTRRRVITGLAAGGTVVAAGGGTTAWWLGARHEDQGEGGRQKKRKRDPFSIPPAVATPLARRLSADDGDYVLGAGPPKRLWGPIRVMHEESPVPLPIRDVIVLGAVQGGIAAHNVVDGKRRWIEPGIRAKGRYLSLDDRLLVAVDPDGMLRTFVPSTGEPKWTAKVDARSLLASDADAVYVATKDDKIRCVSRSDAKIRWTAPVSVRFGSTSGPRGVTGGGRLVVTTADGHVIAVDTRDGHQVWDLPKQSTGLIRPAVHDRTIYVNGDNLTARRITDGHEFWTAKEKDEYDRPVTWGPPSVDGDFVYSAAGSWPRRLKRADGRGDWSSRAQSVAGGPVAVQGSGVWMIDEYTGGVTVVEDRGATKVWSFEVGVRAAGGSGFVVDGNRVFAGKGSYVSALPTF